MGDLSSCCSHAAGALVGVCVCRLPRVRLPAANCGRVLKDMHAAHMRVPS
jgi:hypothetical protein